MDDNIVLNVSVLDILSAKFDLEKDCIFMNHILLLASYFIFKSKLSKVIPSLLVFKAKFKAAYKVELYISKEKANHYKRETTFSLGCLDALHIHVYVYVTFFFVLSGFIFLFLFLFHSY